MGRRGKLILYLNRGNFTARTGTRTTRRGLGSLRVQSVPKCRRFSPESFVLFYFDETQATDVSSWEHAFGPHLHAAVNFGSCTSVRSRTDCPQMNMAPAAGIMAMHQGALTAEGVAATDFQRLNGRRLTVLEFRSDTGQRSVTRYNACAEYCRQGNLHHRRLASQNRPADLSTLKMRRILVSPGRARRDEVASFLDSRGESQVPKEKPEKQIDLLQ